MQALKKRSHFLESPEADIIRRELQHMEASDLYNTVSSFTPNGIQYPDNKLPFLDKHMNYLNVHPSLDADMYVANLRLMTRIR
jgi:hypothetical protein